MMKNFRSIVIIVAALSIATSQATDISIAAASFIPSVNATKVIQTAGATITRGQSLYLDTSVSPAKVKLYKANGTAPQNVFYGLAANDAASGQPIIVITADPALALGGTVAAGTTVIGSGTNAGGVAAAADNASGWWVTVLGVGSGSNTINFQPLAAGAATP